jgi:dipeptidyl aminopeptidase/acylaminoacyl peptidase
VYAGQTYGTEPPGRQYLVAINDPHPLNLQLLSAHGYVVFMPSMPLPKYGELSDPYLELSKGVLPGLAKLVNIGVGDPERLGVMGQSTGGFSTFGLITQIDLFKAAVALAGFSDLVSFYGTFDARLRYQRTADEDPFRVWDLETRGLGGPPWNDMQRYIRNSPISYVDRVHTPVLIIHGDLDPVPIEQDEEFFSALHRQNKRAVFVRYWGEDHVLTSPANVRDMWTRIYKWLDSLLMDKR